MLTQRAPDGALFIFPPQAYALGLSSMPMMSPVVVVMMMPAHLGGEPGTVLDRRGSAGIDQRKRLSAFGWSGKHEACADRGKRQNLRHVHLFLLVP
jgi:hypothetical protein